MSSLADKESETQSQSTKFAEVVRTHGLQDPGPSAPGCFTQGGLFLTPNKHSLQILKLPSCATPSLHP